MSDPPHTLLLVDDEPEILAGLRRTLRREGYRLLTTTSPHEALQLLDDSVDLIMSDIDMPEMSGLELISRTRRAHPDVVRVLLTGDASLDSAVRAINDGEVHRYLTKPWERDQLCATLREALGRLDELRRSAAVDRTAAARDALLEGLAREHPGIRRVAREDGVYVIDVARLDGILDALGPDRPVFFRRRAIEIEGDA